MDTNTLPEWFGKTPLARIVRVYELLWYHMYETRYYANFGMVGKLYKPLLEQFSEWQIAALLVIHFDWRGGTGADEFTYKRLDAAMFPIQWVPSRVSEYSTFLINHEGVDFSDAEAVKKFVKDSLREPHRIAVLGGIITLPNKV